VQVGSPNLTPYPTASGWVTAGVARSVRAPFNSVKGAQIENWSSAFAPQTLQQGESHTTIGGYFVSARQAPSSAADLTRSILKNEDSTKRGGLNCRTVREATVPF
jgi:hypothetical protein